MPLPTSRANGNRGQFEGENAAGFTGAVRVSDHFQLEGGVGFGFGHETVATRLGGTLAW